MMPVETRANPAVMVDRASAERAWRPTGADHGGGMSRKRLHLGEAGLETSGRRLGAFLDQFHQRNLEPLVVLAVGQRHESDAPYRTDRLLQRHVGQRPRRWNRDPAEDLLQA